MSILQYYYCNCRYEPTSSRPRCSFHYFSPANDSMGCTTPWNIIPSVSGCLSVLAATNGMHACMLCYACVSCREIVDQFAHSLSRVFTYSDPGHTSGVPHLSPCTKCPPSGHRGGSLSAGRRATRSHVTPRSKLATMELPLPA